MAEVHTLSGETVQVGRMRDPVHPALARVLHLVRDDEDDVPGRGHPGIIRSQRMS